MRDCQHHKDARVRVFFVDEEPKMHDALAHALANLPDMVVHGCREWSLALEEALSFAPTVILLEFSSSDPDGGQLLELFHGEPCLQEVPLVVLSTLADPQVKAQAFQMGFNDYLVKFPDPIELAARLRYHSSACLTRRQLAATHRSLCQLSAQLEERVALRTRELERSNRDLQEFAYIASHDLQAPLRQVSGFVKLFAKRYAGSLDEKADSYIEYILGGIETMQSLIEGLLGFSRVGSRGVSFVPCDTEAIFVRAVETNATAIAHCQATVTHDPLPLVQGDPLQLLQLFQNLLDNALKFRGERPPLIHVTARCQEGEWLFSMRDSGIGIDARFFERIFLLFQRLHSRQEIPGSGIGLAIAKRVVERHGGRMWVASQPGEGSTFHFSLPCG